VAHQKRQIEKIEVECGVFYQLVVDLIRGSQAMASHPKLSIVFASFIAKDEETI
jgi:hypothetical protein